MDPVVLLPSLVAGYLIGSVSFAVVVSRVMGLPDPHDYGSGNPGATNVLRTGNRRAALFTLLGDALKGVVAVLLARWLAQTLDPAGAWSASLPVLVGIAAFIGHLFPVFHRFRGGKGVATAAGVLLAADPRVGGLVLLTWLAVAFTTRYSSLAALTAAVLAPAWWLWLDGPGAGLAGVIVMGVLLVARHHGNIRKLLAGRESKIGSKKNG